MEDKTTIDRKRYEELLDSDLMLSILEEFGVDNWNGYDEARKEFRKAKEKILKEIEEERVMTKCCISCKHKTNKGKCSAHKHHKLACSDLRCTECLMYWKFPQCDKWEMSKGWILYDCPFCGAPAKVEEIWQPPAVRENEIPAYNVGCQNVGCRGYALYGVFEANIPKEIERWNRRV